MCRRASKWTASWARPLGRSPAVCTPLASLQRRCALKHGFSFTSSLAVLTRCSYVLCCQVHSMHGRALVSFASSCDARPTGSLSPLACELPRFVLMSACMQCRSVTGAARVGRRVDGRRSGTGRSEQFAGQCERYSQCPVGVHNPPWSDYSPTLQHGIISACALKVVCVCVRRWHRSCPNTRPPPIFKSVKSPGRGAC